LTAPDVSFHKIAIVGTGLIGGSCGLALRRAGFRGLRVGCDRPEVLERARASGAIDQGEEDFRQAVQAADLVILATPVGEILRLLPQLKAAVSPGALVTDVGSTKVLICREARRAFGDEPLFLGGHPLAGKERSGVENAEAALFEGALYVLTPENEYALNDPRVKAFRGLVASLGARIEVMDAPSHDRAVAWLSHLPQLVSTALASLTEEQSALPLNLAASGFRDLTRLAESPYALWRDICATNLENIQCALDSLIAKLQALRDHLSDEALAREFDQALKLRQKLRG
jgi:prephenate dehydrogenase